MPWQQAVADIAGEVDHRGRLCYDQIILVIPRQSGKTTLVLSVVSGRAEAGEPFGGRQTMLYAAQTRTDAADKWKKEYVEDILNSRLMKDRVHITYAANKEEVKFLKSRSTFGPVTTKETSGHGKVMDVGFLDEAFSQTNSSIEAAWLPAMSTKPMHQFWVMSTAGTQLSTYLQEKQSAGRLAAEADIGYGIAYIEYSAPEDTDPDDEGAWRRCMPALNHTQEIETIRNFRVGMKEADFKRAYMNIPVGRSTDTPFPLWVWNAARTTPEDSPRATRPVLAVDVSVDRSHTSIVMAAARADGKIISRLVRYAPGTDWVISALIELRDRHDPPKIVMDAAGPAKSLIPEIEREHLDVFLMTAGDQVGACGMLSDRLNDKRGPQVLHMNEPQLVAAHEGAEKRTLGDGWAWTRKVSMETSLADISPLVGMTEAVWAQVRFGDDPSFTWEGSFG